MKQTYNGLTKLQAIKKELEKVGLRKWAKNPANHTCPTCGLFAHWQPIETAPKDGTLIDVWCEPPFPDCEHPGVRLTDVSWHEADEVFPHTGWIRMTDIGNFDLLESGPTCVEGLPAWLPIFWMSLPIPPESL